MSIPAHQIEDARETNLLDLAARYGITLKRAGVNEYCGPCPACGGEDRFGINIKKRTWSCRNCPGKNGKCAGGDAIALVQHVESCTFYRAIEILIGERASDCQPKYQNRDSRPGADRDDESAKRALASVKEIIAEMRPIIDEPRAVAYLEHVRKINVTAIEDVLSRTDAIGWHPSVYLNWPADPVRGTPEHPLHKQRLGCIIGVMTDVKTAEPTGAISRTYLEPDGTKVCRAKTLGRPIGIVRLSPDDEVLGGLHLAEGLETGLSAMAIGLRPMWSTGSSGVLAAFPALSGVEALTVIVDHDINGAGEKAAREVEARWLGAGNEVRLLRPDNQGDDLNDALKAGAK